MMKSKILDIWIDDIRLISKKDLVKFSVNIGVDMSNEDDDMDFIINLDCDKSNDIKSQDFEVKLNKIIKGIITTYYNKNNALPSISRITYEMENQMR